jgi:hypothetical protein
MKILPQKDDLIASITGRGIKAEKTEDEESESEDKS